MITRRRFLQLGIAAGAGSAAGAYAGIQGAHDFTVERVSLTLERLPPEFDGFTIAQLSDLHFNGFFFARDLRRVMGMIDGLRPDLLVVTGDFVTESWIDSRRKVAGNASPCAEILRRSAARLGVVAVLGNHDYWAGSGAVQAALEEHGMAVLTNRAMPLEMGGRRVWLAGLGDALSRDAKLEETLKQVPGKECTVLMVHEPDYADFAGSYAVDLQLSGHSHGGQIVLPIAGRLVLPPMAQKYPAGLYRVGRLLLYSNRGVGTVGVPFRLNCPPEITLLTLRSPAAR